MLTKKHFIAFANEIRLSHGTYAEKDWAAQIIITVARQSNPRFDREKFLAACGLQ